MPYRIDGKTARPARRTVITRFRTYKTAVLLAYLAFYPQRAHPREQLLELLWPECDPDAGRNNLSKALSSLRRQLEPPGMAQGAVLLADRASLQLNPLTCTTDVAEFQAAMAAVGDISRSTAWPLLHEMVERYGGELLPGYYEDWNLTERARLTSAYLMALRRLILQCEQRQEFARALDYARRVAQSDPLSEQAHADLIRLYASAGQSADALRQYRLLEQMLDTEFGLLPDPTLGALIAQAAVQIRPAAPPPMLTLPVSVSPHLQTGTFTVLVMRVETAGEFARRLPTLLSRYEAQWVDTNGTTHLSLFSRASSALECALEARRLSASLPPSGSSVSAVSSSAVLSSSASSSASSAMALHTGEVWAYAASSERPAVTDLLDYAACLFSAAQPGQLLCSEATAALLSFRLKPGLELKAQGQFRLNGLEGLTRLFLIHDCSTSASASAESASASSVSSSVSSLPPNAEPAWAYRLPLALTSFIGREEEIARLTDWLNASGVPVPGAALPAAQSPPRLITLTGMGGAGKTRLALALAQRLIGPFQGEVWFVSLAALLDTGRLPETLLASLRIPLSAGQSSREQAFSALAGRNGLLILDNFEQLLDAPNGKSAASGSHVGAGEIGEKENAVRFVAALLEQAPGLKCVVTSRRRLNLAGEHEIPVLPLPTLSAGGTPEQVIQTASVRLFVERAQAVRPDFQLTRANTAVIAALCVRLEGIPLALELAAARITVLTPAQMLARMDRRLDLLARRGEAGNLRHQTLRSTMDWSYRLLPGDLRRLWTRLSVFHGGCTLEAAAAVCQDTGAQTDTEAHAQPIPREIQTEFTTLDGLARLQECSLLQTEETPGLQMRFRMLETLRQYAQEKLGTNDTRRYQDAHARCYLNLAEAVEPFLAGAEQETWLTRLEQEHDNFRATLRWFAGLPDASFSLRLTGALARFWAIRGHLQEGQEHLAAALAQAASSMRTAARAKALHGAAGLYRQQGKDADAQALYETALQVWRELEDKSGMAAALNGLGNLARHQGDYAQTRVLYEESLRLRQEINDSRGTAGCLNNLGTLALDQADPEAAQEFLEASRKVYHALDDKYNLAIVLNNLGAIAHWQGDLERARVLYTECLQMTQELGDQHGAASVLNNLGDLALAQEDYDTACGLLEQSLQIRRDLEDAVGVASVLDSLGIVARLQRDYARSRALLQESLRLRLKLGEKRQVAEGLEAFASLETAQKRFARAAQLFGAADALRARIDSPAPPDSAEEQRAQQAAAQQALGASAFQQALKRGKEMSLDQAVALALASPAKEGAVK